MPHGQIYRLSNSSASHYNLVSPFPAPDLPGAPEPAPAGDLAAMTAACMKDVDDISDVDEDDPDLLVSR